MVCSTSSSVCASDVKPACKVARQVWASFPQSALGKSCISEGSMSCCICCQTVQTLRGVMSITLCVHQDLQGRSVQEAARPHTSYADGARYTPLSSMPLCQRPNLAMSALVASSKQLTGPFVKKNPNMPASNYHLTQDSEHLPTERVAAMESNRPGPQPLVCCRPQMHAAAIYHVMCHNRKSPS